MAQEDFVRLTQATRFYRARVAGASLEGLVRYLRDTGELSDSLYLGRQVTQDIWNNAAV